MSELTRLHENMITCIHTKMPILKEIKAYNPTTRDSITTPAVLIELAEMVPTSKTGLGALSIKAEFVAHCILSTKTLNVELEIRNFALDVMKNIHGERWGLAEFVQRPEQLSAYPGAFSPDEAGYESWVVTWTQTLDVGDSVFGECTEFVADKVFIGFAPEIGPPHKDKYWEVTADG